MHNGPENEATGRVEGVPNAMNMAAQRLFDKFKRKIGCGSLTNDDVYVSGWCSLAFVGLVRLFCRNCLLFCWDSI